ncbi:response regulator [Rubellimicrobium aerolatum]|uniref:histidine kinase n=1 Tax=Rubellimicrobium aerolatum TaxID=490979 RepID=A0ABW0SFB2_9RHOB|nr:response regulator [Rubellimicrobium aerolatum]MBP1807098.1 PAS domain S-box-containing protein [Rubellimicrobium aerolatum]
METAVAPSAALDPDDRPSLDALGLGLYRIDEEGRCTYANPAALAMLGYEASEVIGRNMHDLIHHSHPDGSRYPQSACPLLAARQAGRPVRLAGEVLWRKDGGSLVADYAAWPLLRDGRVTGSVVTILPGAGGAARDRLALQLTVSRLLAGTAGLDEVLPRLLAAVAEGLGGRAAVLWDLSHREKRLHPRASWVAPGLEADGLIERTLALTLGRGEGLPGRAWEADELVHVDLGAEGGDARAEAARAAGLGFALAIPVRIGRRVLGAIELWAPARLELDDGLLDGAAALGQQIGQYLRRKRAEESLREREEEFRALAEGIPQMTWTADPDGVPAWFNRRWHDYAGLAPERMADGGWRDLVHPGHLGRVEEGYREAIESGEVWEDTFPLRGRDGRYRWFLSRAVPILDEDGQVGRWFGSNTDITEQRRAEIRAVAAERRLRFALQVARIGSWSWDIDAGTLEADEGLRAIFGLPAGEGDIPAEAFFARLHPDDAPAVEAAFDAARDGLGELDIEFRVVAGAGEVRWAVARGAVERRPLSRGLHALGIVWDVTERKRHEEDLAAAKVAAEEANLAKSQFIANMSHELRTPLSAIIGYAELLAEEAGDLGAAGAAIGADLARIEGSARHLLSLINGVLDLSKIEAGRMEVEVESFEVAPLVREVCETVRGLMERKGNAFAAELAPDLGAMRSDAVKLRQCLFNLLSNAAKFTEGGRVTLEARRAGGQVGGGRLVFRVADTGIGMTPEQVGRLFQRFAQADVSTTRRFGGTGLGLALTRAFAGMLGGDIAVESVEGVGTTFTLALPDDAGRAAGGAAPPEGEPAEAGRVLVIDDDPHMRDLLTRFLGRNGVAVEAAPDGEAGLAAARRSPPSAILLDVMMPRMDGWAVLSALKAEPALAEVPVIMVSMIRDKGLAYSLGAADHLTKPVDWQRLRDAVERHRGPAGGAADPDPGAGPDPGLALVAEEDDASREGLAGLLAGEGWDVVAAPHAEAARERLAERRPDLVLVNLGLPAGGGLALLRDLRRDPAWRTIPVIALAEGALPPEARAPLGDGATPVIPTGEDGAEELLAELRRVAAERGAGGLGNGEASADGGAKEGTAHG